MAGGPVVIACCRASVEATAGDLYPDPDSERLVQALADRGVEAAMFSWDDPTVAWQEAGAVVVRSTWDSVDRPAEFLRWARRVGGLTTLVNPAGVLAWNLDKIHLRELSGLGVPVVPTVFVEPGSACEVPDGDVVIKPAVSAGGRETALYPSAQREAAEAHASRLLAAGRTVMVQPYLPAVEDPGEISLVYIDAVFSHGIRKAALLEPGAGVVERPWERPVASRIDRPTPAERAVADAVQEILHRRFGRLTYSRIDLIGDTSGTPLVLEVELVDPYLWLGLAPGAEGRLAGAIADRALQAARPGGTASVRP